MKNNRSDFLKQFVFCSALLFHRAEAQGLWVKLLV